MGLAHAISSTRRNRGAAAYCRRRNLIGGGTDKATLLTAISDIQIDPGTGTILVRIFDNAKRELVPGHAARVRLYIGDTKSSLVFSERALLSDGGQDFVCVMNDKKVVEPRRVRLGKRTGELVEAEDGRGRPTTRYPRRWA